MKKYKKIIVTEKDLRKILEKRFYTHQRSSGYGYGRGSDACVLASAGEASMDSREEKLKRSIVASVASKGGGPEPSKIPANKIIWNGPRTKKGLQTKDKKITYTIYRLTFGVDSLDGYGRRAIQINYQAGLSTADADVGSSEAQKLVRATIAIRDASVTSKDGYASGALLHQDDKGTIKPEYKNEWYYSVTPKIVEWLKDWAESEELCPEDEREDLKSGGASGGSGTGGSGVAKRGALDKTTWWSGSAQKGRPVSSSDSGKTVLVVTEMNRGVYQKLIEQHPGLKKAIVERTTYAFFLPNTSEYRGIFNDSALRDAQANIAQHRKLVSNYGEAFNTFNTQPARNLFNALAHAVATYNEQTGESQNITIDMSS